MLDFWFFLGETALWGVSILVSMTSSQYLGTLNLLQKLQTSKLKKPLLSNYTGTTLEKSRQGTQSGIPPQSQFMR